MSDWMVKLLPTVLIVLMAAAGLVYLLGGQGWKACYWFSGALLNVAVTYGS